MKENYKQLQEQYSSIQEINKQLKEQYSALLVKVDELMSEQMCTSPVLFSPPTLPPPICTPTRTNSFLPSPPIPNTNHPTLLSLDETNLYELSNPPVHPFQPSNSVPIPNTRHPHQLDETNLYELSNPPVHPFQPSDSVTIPNTQHPHQLDETNLYELSNTPLTPVVHSFQPFNPSPTTETQHPYASTLSNIDYSPSFLVKTRAMSCSRGNFAANLNREWFTVSERKTCNIRGRNGKKQLSPQRVKRIYDAVFQMYPCFQKTSEKEAWAECVRAIDESNRRLNRKGKENYIVR